MNLLSIGEPTSHRDTVTPLSNKVHATVDHPPAEATTMAVSTRADPRVAG